MAQCEVSVTINLPIYKKDKFQTMRLVAGFTEEYDDKVEGARDSKYYELLEATQTRLMELADETRKTVEAIKNQENP